MPQDPQDPQNKMTAPSSMKTVVRAEFEPGVVLYNEDGSYALAMSDHRTGKWMVFAISEPDGSKYVTAGELDLELLEDSLGIQLPEWVRKGMEG